MERKGMEMSMNVIIIAVIALLILVIIVYLVANQVDLFGKGKACTQAGGRCINDGGCAGTDILRDAATGGGPLCGGTQVCCAIVPLT